MTVVQLELPKYGDVNSATELFIQLDLRIHITVEMMSAHRILTATGVKKSPLIP